MSNKTKAFKKIMDGFADFLDGKLSGGNGLGFAFFMVSSSVMGCAGYGSLPCDTLTREGYGDTF